MSFLSSIVIKAVESHLVEAGPEIEAMIMQELGALGSEFLAYVTHKTATAALAPAADVQIPPAAE